MSIPRSTKRLAAIGVATALSLPAFGAAAASASGSASSLTHGTAPLAGFQTESDADPSGAAGLRVHYSGPIDRVEIRLDCGLIVADAAAIECAWQTPDLRGVHHYELYRLVEGDHRELLGEFGLDHRPHYIDRDLTAGSVHSYAVLAVNRAGRIIANSPVEAVRVPEREIDVRLACENGREVAVTCAWPAVERPNAASYVLWKTNGDVHTAIDRGDATVAGSFTDTNNRPGTTVGYMLEVLDASGQQVAMGGVVRVEIPEIDLERPVTDLERDIDPERDVAPEPVRDVPSDRVTDRERDRVRDRERQSDVARGDAQVDVATGVDVASVQD